MFSNLGFLIFMIRKSTFEFHFNGTLQNFLVGTAYLLLQLKKHYCFYEFGTVSMELGSLQTYHLLLLMVDDYQRIFNWFTQNKKYTI